MAFVESSQQLDPDFAAWYEPRRLKLVEEDPTTSYVLARREGLAVEDIEESLGLPRGWTFVEGCTDQQRLDALRAAI